MERRGAHRHKNVRANWRKVALEKRSRFSGKERDAESGLDYFGARYFSGAQGRFTSVDPKSAGAAPSNPQSWNGYAYCLNNPLALVDQNGKWPTFVHNIIIREAFPGLSPASMEILFKASYETDFVNRVNGLYPQDPEVAFIHGMADGLLGQSGDQAKALGDRFIEENVGLAQQKQTLSEMEGRTGMDPEALRLFGIALHTITDRISPPHAGDQPWLGTSSISDKLKAVRHGALELYRPGAEKQAIKEAREAFKKAFGEAAYIRAIHVRKKKKEDEENQQIIIP